jgi:hypothetical protein
VVAPGDREGDLLWCSSSDRSIARECERQRDRSLTHRT